MNSVRKQNQAELDDLRQRLREAEETLLAIRTGEVDALIVSGPTGEHQVFSLRGAEQPYRIFLEQMQEGAVTLTPDGTILYCNRRFADMIRIPLERVISASLRSFIRESDQGALAEIFAGTSQSHGEFQLVAGDGTQIPVRLSFSRMPIDDVQALCLVVTDLTEQREKRDLARSLATLREAQDLLQQQNDELAAARRVAEQASKAKDDFLAALSHELRTPLTPVLMTAAALEQDPGLPAEARADIQMIRRNVEMEARLIDDLLDITRIVHGKISMQSETVDAHDLLASALDICRGDAEAKELELQVNLQASRHHLLGDGVRLQQIFWNIIRNAVKFTPARGRISVTSDNDDEGRLVVTISDSGIGIESGALGRIFSPFEQADSVVARQFGGLGLGLAISRTLVELHGGTIVASSEGKNHGSTFTVALPTLTAGRVDATDRVERPATRSMTSSSSAPAASVPRNGHALRILLVEDHDDTRRNMARLLRGLQHRVEQTRSMHEALAAAAAHPFDLVISDVGLPDGSGLELMRQLHQRHSLRGICLSGYGSDEDVARSMAAGFLEHFTKPINFAELEQSLHRFTLKHSKVQE